MMDYEKPEAVVVPQVFEFTSQQGQSSLDDRSENHNGIIPDIEFTSTLAEEIGEPTPPGIEGESLRLIMDQILLIDTKLIVCRRVLVERHINVSD